MKGELPLKDIHIPGHVDWWPIAPGWWLVLLLIIFFSLLAYKKYRQKSVKAHSQMVIDQALDVLTDLESCKDNKKIITEVSILLRRVSMSLYGRDNIAGLTGSEWLLFLDQQGKTTDFSQGAGEALLELPYRKKGQYDRVELLAITKAWLIQQGKQVV